MLTQAKAAIRPKHSNPVDPEILRLQSIVEVGLKLHRLKNERTDAEILFRVRSQSYDRLIAEATAEFDALQAAAKP